MSRLRRADCRTTRPQPPRYSARAACLSAVRTADYPPARARRETHPASGRCWRPLRRGDRLRRSRNGHAIKGHAPFGLDVQDEHLVRNGAKQQVIRLMRQPHGTAHEPNRRLESTENAGVWQADTVRPIRTGWRAPRRDVVDCRCHPPRHLGSLLDRGARYQAFPPSSVIATSGIPGPMGE